MGIDVTSNDIDLDNSDELDIDITTNDSNDLDDESDIDITSDDSNDSDVLRRGKIGICSQLERERLTCRAARPASRNWLLSDVAAINAILTSSDRCNTK